MLAPWRLHLCFVLSHAAAISRLMTHNPLQVCDFNLSRVMEETVVLSSMAASNPRWLAPEILGGKGYSFSSDVYSFGMIMWEFLTWQVPWHDCGPWQVRPDFSPLRLCGARPGALRLLQAPGILLAVWLCSCPWCQHTSLQGAPLKAISHGSDFHAVLLLLTAPGELLSTLVICCSALFSVLQQPLQPLACRLLPL